MRALIRRQLEGVSSWDEFLRTRIVLDPAELVGVEDRERLQALPGSLHVRGDAVPLDYEIQNGEGVARVRLREGQAKRLRADELPRLDRPLRFAVQRGRHPPILADTIPALQEMLRRSPRTHADEDSDPGRHRGGRRRQRQGHRARRGGGPRGRPRR